MVNLEIRNMLRDKFGFHLADMRYIRIFRGYTSHQPLTDTSNAYSKLLLRNQL